MCSYSRAHSQRAPVAGGHAGSCGQSRVGWSLSQAPSNHSSRIVAVAEQLLDLIAHVLGVARVVLEERAVAIEERVVEADLQPLGAEGVDELGAPDRDAPASPRTE